MRTPLAGCGNRESGRRPYQNSTIMRSRAAGARQLEKLVTQRSRERQAEQHARADLHDRSRDDVAGRLPNAVDFRLVGRFALEDG